ncbi:MAG: hypothetical protein E7059_06365 [Treponema bryantii]|nr:hypothetical protein [Treponema bryantii]
MIVLILDLDWIFDKSELPNVDCMKLSSFHKQRKDTVYFVGDMSELTMTYDRLYVFGESDSTPTMSSKILNDERTVLFGKRFELCGAKKLGTVVMGCRPDYLLYDVTDEKSNSYIKANFVTFYTDCGEKIQKRQSWKNTKKGVKRTIVTDTTLWRQKPEEIEQCFEELKGEKNIVFLAPISIKFLIDNRSVQEKFFRLHFSKGTKFKWRNDIGSDEQSAQKIVSFLNDFRKHTKSNIGAIPIRAIEQGEVELESLKRLIKVFAIFKQNKIKCFLPPIEHLERITFQWLRSWCEKGFENSFIEEMVFFASASKGTRWFHIINEPKYWGTQKTKFLINLLCFNEWRELLPQMSVQWGNNSIDCSCIDFNIIDKYAFSLI